MGGHKELDEVRAPADVFGAGDRGVVTAEFDRPRRAVGVMFDDADGEPGSCVV